MVELEFEHRSPNFSSAKQSSPDIDIEGYANWCLRLFLCCHLNSVTAKPPAKKNLQVTDLVLEERQLPLLWFSKV